MFIIFLFFSFSCIANPDTLFNLGRQAFEEKNPVKAKHYFQQVLQQDVTNIHALRGMAFTYFYENNLPQACAYFQRCVACNSQDPDLIELYATVLDHTGQFERARDLFEMLHDYDHTRQQPRIKLPPLYIRNKEWYFVGKFVRNDKFWWYDSDIKNKKILLDLSSEWNGRGDVMQIIRYGKHLYNAGAKVVVFVRPDLVTLLQLCPYLEKVVGTNQEKPTADITYELTTDRCMVVMRDQLYSPSTDVPYLYADEQLVKKWHKRLSIDATINIGICWQSVKMLDYFTQKLIPGPKSITLDQLAPLLEQSNITFYSLQKDEDAEIASWNKHHASNQIISYHDLDTLPFMDSAAMMKNLHLIITVDTAIAHLAGALGVPVWLILPYVADYRWFNQTENTSPLYPSMIIFRQSRTGDWNSVIQTITNKLKGLCKNA
jgi:tetratricopeptide (TPR) repeat protein